MKILHHWTDPDSFWHYLLHLVPMWLRTRWPLSRFYWTKKDLFSEDHFRSFKSFGSVLHSSEDLKQYQLNRIRDEDCFLTPEEKETLIEMIEKNWDSW